MKEEIVLELKHIRKKYGNHLVLDDVAFQLKKGEVHALVGENGAGKSTLIKIISGVVKPEPGSEIYVNGEKISKITPAGMMEKGITVMYQDISLFQNLSVAENICMKSNVTGFFSKKKFRSEARKILDSMGCKQLDETEECSRLSVAQQQLVLLARAVYFKAKIVIMDEPTSALSSREIQMLYQTIRTLQKNVSVIYISHKLDEIYQISDRITVLRDGKVEAVKPTEIFTYQDLVEAMIGKRMDSSQQKKHVAIGKELLRLEGFSRSGAYQNISFSIKEGEIVGLIGLVGAGRTELALGMIGVEKPEKGQLFLEERLEKINGIGEAIEKGVCYLTENRAKYGLFLEKSVGNNITSASLKKFAGKFGMDRGKESEAADKSIRYIGIKTPDRNEKVKNLSGGNQQKVLFSKWIYSEPKVLIVDEPTAGVDIGAKSEIYGLLSELAERGVGILMISSELNEILTVADRILVMNHGRIVYEAENSRTEEDQILEKMITG